MSEFTADIRSIPLWLLREYLEQLGGVVTQSGRIEGAGWTACLNRIEDYRIGSLRVGQVRLEVVGDSAAVARLRELLEPKLIRGGG